MTNTLYYGDNLDILRQHVPDESVDLVYLDPPFNSNANYNVLFKEQSGEASPAQIRAFTDTWEWTQEAERTYEQEIITNPGTPANVKDMISAFRQFIGQNAMMAYLVMMTPRLVELRRVLKPAGSIYLHCDPTASHYLKLLMDTILGKENFRNEIIWRRTDFHSSNTRFGRIHDVILFYSRTANYFFQKQVRPYHEKYVGKAFRFRDKRGAHRHGDLTAAEIRTGDSGSPWKDYDPTAAGRHWAIPAYLREDLERRGESLDGLTTQEKLDLAFQHDLIYLPDKQGGQPAAKRYLADRHGAPIQDIWAYQPHTEGQLWNSDEGIDGDVKWVQTPERLSYPTQKPVGLLSRIIRASSNEGDVVLDPFCGCGTSVAAAENLERRWIGIDITHLAVALMKSRLRTAFDLHSGADYEVVGEPADVGSARALAEQDRYQFQYWAMSLLEALPRKQDERRGADRGIDGVVHFIDGPRRTTKKAIVQVKSGKVSSPLIRDLKGTVEREKADLGLFITLEESTRDMRTEAASAGFYHSEIWQRDYPKMQIRTIAELLGGHDFDIPPHPSMYQPAQRVHRPEGRQTAMPDTV